MERLKLIAQNRRFLVLADKAQAPNLASQTLAAALRALPEQWLATFGYPISEEFQERNPDTGQTYTVQYFERARMEYHPEYAGTEYEVLLGRLIGNQLDAAGWTTSSDLRLPTRREFQ